MNCTKKIILFLFCVAVCGLTACGTPKLPDKSGIAVCLDEYYAQRSCKIDSIEIVEEIIDKDDQTAYRTCNVSATAIDNSFRTVDSWEAYYILRDKGGWEFFDTTFVSSAYELLEDFSESDCLDLLDDVLPYKVEISSITTERENYAATASYSYSYQKNIAGGAGTLNANASGVARFSWDMLNRWTLESQEEDNEYIYNATLNLQVETGPDTLSSERFQLSMGVEVENNVPSLEVVDYQWDVDTAGNLIINNVRLEENKDDPEDLEIIFDFERTLDDIENDKNYSAYYAQLGAYRAAEGDGRLIISSDGSADLILNKWIYNGWQHKWENYLYHPVTHY